MKPKIFFYSGGSNLWLLLWTILIGALMLAAAGAWGLAKVAEWVVPSMGGLAVLGLGIFVVGVIPLSLIREWRPSTARTALLISSAYGLGVWMVSFLVLWKWLGLMALPTIFLSFLAAPLAILRLCFVSDWNQAAGIVIAALIAQGIRSYAVWLAAGTVNSGDASVIDAVVVESRVICSRCKQAYDPDAGTCPQCAAPRIGTEG